MVILRQEQVFRYNVKGKFVDCWMILTHELDGPTLALFKDQSAKKLVENRLILSPLASRIRFGTTTLNIQTGSTPPLSFFPQIKASDVRVHGSSFILIQTEKLVRKQPRPHFIWLCAKSTQQLFDIVRAISSCLVSMKIGAPLSNAMEDLNSLHKYRPKPFEAKNDWEAFWDNPPKTTTDLQVTSKTDLMRNSGIAMSMDAINGMQMKEGPNKLDGSKKKNIKQSIYSSIPAFETQHSLQQNNTHLDAFRTRSNSRSSTASRESKMSRSNVYLTNANCVVEEALPPIYELKRDRELTEKSKASNRSRLYEPRSGGETAYSYSAPDGKSSSKKTDRYFARRDSTLSNIGIDSGDTSSVILPRENVLASREIGYNKYQSSPHSILKNKSVVQTKSQQKPKYSSESSYSSSTPTRSTHTQTNKPSSRRRPSEMSVAESLVKVNNTTPSHDNVPSYIAIQNLDSSAVFIDAEVQTEHNKTGSPTLPLIAIGSGYPVNGSHPQEDEFQSQVHKLKQVSQHNVINTPVNNHPLNGHAAPLGLTLAPPTAPSRKLTPTAPNPIAFAVVSATATQKKQATNGNSFNFSSSDSGSMSSDFNDEDNQSYNTGGNSSGASTPKMVNNEKSTEECIYRISVDGTSNF